MDKLTYYQKLIKNILTQYYEWASNSPQDEVKECLAFDDEHQHYLWFHIGWNHKQRVLSIMVCLRIQDDKIWVEEDRTKQGIVNDLLASGVVQEDIVLGFQHPSKRYLTEFANL
jgi:XisI protein